MKCKEAASLLVAVLTAVSLCPRPVNARADLSEELNSLIAGKFLMLRHFYRGDHLSFHLDGTPIGASEIGPWTVFGQILVKRVELKDHRLRIEGRRVNLIFDSKGSPYRDVLNYLEEVSKTSPEDKPKKCSRQKQKPPDGDAVKKFYLSQNVEIEIALASENPSAQEVADALPAVFMRPEESLADIVPEFWRDYIDRIEGRPRRAKQSNEKVYRVMRGGASPPRAIYQPEPEFSAEAQMARFQGVEIVSVVVDASGGAREIEIISPLGLGLDEKGVDSISRWKFEPARKDGKPVPVRIAIEVDFHLH